ncbi:hypothetical protein BJF85_18655 [Saccharomonospora sp. CUA-673]|nr:hypothetical protein BJF85_18655 [Saccharomonospora sp. CUA-673]
MGDSLIAVVLFLVDALFIMLLNAFPTPETETPRWYVGLPLAVGLLAAMPARRSHPVLMAYWVLGWSIPHVALGLMDAPLSVAAASCIALYTLVVYTTRRTAAVYTALTVGVSMSQQLIEFPDDVLVNMITIVLSLALCWVLGEFVGARRAYQAEVEARLALLENERHQSTRIAVAEERERIARELHDVVAHSVSVIVVHADGASYAVRKDPDLAERAIGTISETGRSALAELRGLLAILRDNRDEGEGSDSGSDGADSEGSGGGAGSGSAPARTPQPTTADLDELADRMRGAGLLVRLETEGALDDLPAGVALGTYRIVQEALTNSLKHAGVGARTHVRVRRADEGAAVSIDVEDDGAGRAHPVLAGRADVDGTGAAGAGVAAGASGSGSSGAGAAGAAVPASGNGLIGMRERVNVHGGTLKAGPAPGGGWRVRAVLPVPADPHGPGGSTGASAGGAESRDADSLGWRS